jgi:hypothetical protein
MLEKLIMLFARKPATVKAGRGGASALTNASAVPPSPMRMMLAPDADGKDPEPPPVTLTMVERRRIYVNPLNEYGGKISCGPFEWSLSDERTARLDVAANTRSAWIYPVALGQCAVTVTGAKRESTLSVAIVPAIPATLNLIAEEPEVFRGLAALDGTAAGVL